MPKSSPSPRPGDSSTQFDDADDFFVDPRLKGDETAGDTDEAVFFDADESLDEHRLAGDTTTLFGPEVDDLIEAAMSARSSRESDLSDMLNAAPVFDEESDERPPGGTGLTAVGLPSFDDPPESAKTPAESASNSAPAIPGLDPAPDPISLEDTDVQFVLRDQLSLDVPPEVPPVDSLPVVDVENPTPVKPRTKQRKLRTDDAVKKKPSARHAAAPPPQDMGRRRLMLILLASYASAVTLALGWLWMNRQSAQPHELESLPDVAPLDANEFRYVPQSATMPPGHTLPLGEKQQLGWIQVEPLRVTRDAVEFVHYENPANTRPPTGPVLMLWVRFTNLSEDQLIAPLDATLLFTRSYQSETDTLLANQLVLPADKSAEAPAAYVLDHPQSSEWDLKGQRLGHRLKPGESLETYVPVDPETTAALTGDLVWRLHFRKGYNPQTGNGVTTLIEIPFDADQITADPT